MWRWLAFRLAAALLTLLGITLLTFAVLDAMPADRAAIEAAGAAEGTYPDAAARAAAVLRLRVRYGLVEPETMVPRPFWQRYAAWVGSAATLRLAGPGEDQEALWRRLARALPVSMLLGGLALGVALGLGVPLGVRLGRQPGTVADRAASTALVVLASVPEFLLATLLVLAFGVLWLPWFPIAGLRSAGAEQWSLPAQWLDCAHHLALPVATMALMPLVLVVRFVRAAVARAARAPFVTSLHALGVESRVVRRRLLRHGATPVATLAGSLLPLLVTGSVVVENVFALDGLGHLLCNAILQQDQATVMALVVVTSVATLLALVVSDLLHRLVDPRVRLSR